MNATQRSNRVIVTVIGQDRVGIIAGVATILADASANILDISQSIMEEFFVMIMMADLENATVPFEELKRRLAAKGAVFGSRVVLATPRIKAETALVRCQVCGVRERVRIKALYNNKHLKATSCVRCRWSKVHRSPGTAYCAPAMVCTYPKQMVSPRAPWPGVLAGRSRPRSENPCISSVRGVSIARVGSAVVARMVTANSERE